MKITDNFIITQKNLPLGCSSYVFSINSLKEVYKSYITKKNDTGFIYFFTKTKLCRTYYIESEEKIAKFKNARLTVDYIEDIKLIKIIFNNFKNKTYFSINELISFLKKNPKLLDINKSLDKEYWNRTKKKAKLRYRLNEEIIDINISN